MMMMMKSLPHAVVPPPRRSGAALHPHRSSFSLGTALLMVVTAVLSFFCGSLSTLYAGIDCNVRTTTTGAAAAREGDAAEGNQLNDVLLESKLQQRMMVAKDGWMKEHKEETEKQVAAAVLQKEQEQQFRVDKAVQAAKDICEQEQRTDVAEMEKKIQATTDACNKEKEQLLAEEERKREKALAESVAAANAAAAAANKNDDNSNNKENAASSALAGLLPQDTVGRYATAMARLNKTTFTTYLDLGVPIDPVNEKSGDSEALILYSRVSAIPAKFPRDDHTGNPLGIPSFQDAAAALEHCDYVNVILTDHSNRKQCVAIVPQYESYHVQKWMRINDETNKLDSAAHLQMVSRGHQSNGIRQFSPPRNTDTKKHWSMLSRYFSNLDDVLKELDGVLKPIAVDNTVIVMVCNYGQVELLMNFVCSSQAKGFDLKNVIVFTTDEESTDLAKSMGLATFYDHRNFGDIPTGAAKRYGDAKFVAMMMAKVICVQLVSMLGYDMLFQDVDMVWFRDPMTYFRKPEVQQFDVFFQDDGGHTIRYAPYSANSGFYFVKNNDRTKYFLTSILMSGDLIIKTDSHQQALIAVLNEHVSLYGLRAKVLSRDEPDFPGGYQYHQKSGKYMKQYFAGKVQPYIFHMSWTLNKDNKLLYFRQLGAWYLRDKCIDTKRDDIVKEIIGGSGSSTTNATAAMDLRPTCCTKKPLITCHYRDKPSIIPCKDSPPIDKGRPSFW